jgi:hypothetical protein
MLIGPTPSQLWEWELAGTGTRERSEKEYCAPWSKSSTHWSQQIDGSNEGLPAFGTDHWAVGFGRPLLVRQSVAPPWAWRSELTRNGIACIFANSPQLRGNRFSNEAKKVFETIVQVLANSRFRICSAVWYAHDYHHLSKGT